ncbi:hypothetical protein D0Q02_02115 [Micromonospora craniellae]|uniref:Uncharacterized protein n=1 Tax=Micromonospora craniellae TaxID=2294034 RepID=A0A372G6A1_9ACTN|nr:hypothetical protein D0Q02_02115 [Micromonospora craniellae]
MAVHAPFQYKERPAQEVVTVLFGAVLAALVLGYLAGLWSFKVKSRWCPRCGAMTGDLTRSHVGHAL